MNVRLRPDVVLVSVCDEQLLVAAGEARGRVPYVKGINKPGAYFWRLLEQNLGEQTIIARAAADYACSEATAREALRRFLEALEREGYLLPDEGAGREGPEKSEAPGSPGRKTD